MDIGSKIYNILDKLTKRNEYSTSERVIGKWIDGKPIYRKVCDLGSWNMGAGANARSLGISNIESIISIKPMKYYGTDGYLLWNDQAINVGLSSGNIIFSQTNGLTWVKVVVIIEYTKTTD